MVCVYSTFDTDEVGGIGNELEGIELMLQAKTGL